MMEHGRDASQKAELRERIIMTATEAFTLKGIKCITMDDIAAALGISKRTLYEVFADKESLLKECILDIKKYPKVYAMMKDRSESDSEKTMSFFKSGVEQGIFRADVNFEIVNLLVREQFDVLLNTDICNEYPFIEVYESIMFTYIRGISTEKGAKVLEEFISEYRKNRVEQQ